MKKESYAILFILSALAFRELFLLFPVSETVFDPFPYADVDISFQSYIYFFCYYISNLLLIAAFIVLVSDYTIFFHLWFAIQVVEILDYYFTYNQAWFKVGDISVGITLVKLITLTLTILVQWFHSYYYRQA